MSSDGPYRDAKVTIRMPRNTKELIERAAAAVNRSFGVFVVESAGEHAIRVLMSQTVFHLSAEQGEAFACVLENPPAPNGALEDLMKSESPWK